MISQSTIQEILNRLDVTEIVGEFVKLKKRGANYLGLCPFHNEKTPSFTVSPAKEIYKCFGCGRSGNSISFLMEHEKYSYTEALKWLANKYNVEIEETELSPEIKQLQQLADSLYIINNFAQKNFSDNLFNTEEGVDIGYSYLKERGFGEDIIKKFQLGYCLQQRDAFAKAALAAQYNKDILQKTGLVVMRDELLVDNYRGRIIFPVHNNTGKVIGFGARIIAKNDKAPKYINTPENELYIKSKILYGSYFARQAIDKNDECLLVEGYTDVISLHQAGIENVVASGGTSLTVDQLRLVKKYTNNLTIIYDGDSAGIKAALRGLDMALEEGLNVKLVLIPDKEDPDSYVNKVGAQRFREFIQANKKDFILFLLEVSLNETGDDSNKKASLVNQIAETIAKVNRAEDFTKQQDYIKECSRILKIDEQGFTTLVNKYIRDYINKSENKSISREKENINPPEAIPNDMSDETFSLLFQDQLQEKALIRVLLTHGNRQWEGGKTVADCIMAEEFEEELFNNKHVHKIMRIYENWHKAGLDTSINKFAYLDDQELVRYIIESTNHPYNLSPRWNDEDKAHTINKRIFDLNCEDFLKQITSENSNELIYYHEIDDNYKNEVDNVIIYLKIKKINRLILLNEEDLKNNNLPTNKILEYQQTHMHLKEIQRTLSSKKGIVIYPFN